MKLYAKTTSERASKGQGGNKYINTEYFVGDAKYPQFIGKTKLYIYEGQYQLDYYHPDGEVIELIKFDLEKGKSQKGEKWCNHHAEVSCDNCKSK